MVDIEQIPKELLNKREIIECNFIMSGYKDPLSIAEYLDGVANGEDIITQSGNLYYGILSGMIKAGFNQITDMSVFEYISDKPGTKQLYEESGGWDSIREMVNLISVENIEVYHDELVKGNFLIKLWQRGFPVLKELDKFKQMTSEQVYDYYEYLLSDIAIGKIEKIKAENLSEGYDSYIEEWDQGDAVGYNISSKMLNARLLGLHKKNLLLHEAGIGRGKTTSAIHWYILPQIEDGEDVTIIANEQGVSEWRQMILSTVVFNKIDCKVKGLNRTKILKGHYTEEQKAKLYEGAEWIKKQPGKIRFIETQDYGTTGIKKVFTKYSRLGCNIFVVDTLKPEREGEWADFSEVAKTIFLEAKRLDICAIATCQLSPEAMNRKYLDLTCSGKAKAIAETANSVVMIRDITPEEKLKIEGYVWEGKIKKTITLDPSKDYVMVFTPKDRFGPVDPQIIMERNMSFNSYKDYCWYDCPRDFIRPR